MKVGAVNGVKLAAASTLAAVALVPMGRLIVGLDVPSAATMVEGDGKRGGTESSVTKNTGNLNAFDPTLRSDRLELSEGTEYEGTGRNIFRIEIPVSRTPQGPKPSPPVAPKQSPPPTVRLRFFGFASTAGDDKKMIFLSDEGDVFVGREGDIINRRYKILQITPMSVEMEDLINDVPQTLLLGQG